MAITSLDEARERPCVDVRDLGARCREVAVQLEALGHGCAETGLLSETQAVRLALMLKELADLLADRVEESWNGT